MKFVAIIVTLVCCGLMFFVKREWKAGMLVMGAMTLTVVDVPGIPLHKANFLLQATFLLSEWRNLPRYVNRLRYSSYLWIPLLIVGFSALLAALTSQYTGISEMIKSELLFKYFALAYAFWAVKNEKSLKPVLQVSLYCLIVLTAFGALNYIQKNAIFVNALTEGRTSIIHEGVSLGNVFSESARFRVQSMFRFPFDYGYICAAILLLHLHGWYRHLESKRDFIIAIACCSFGILICGSRTVWLSAALSIVCYYMWTFQLSRNVLYGIFAMMLMMFSYLTIPAVEEKVNQVTDIFAENSETRGSSIQMRMSQYGYVLIHTEGHRLLGLGKGYWTHTHTEDRESVRGLYGVESVILEYLLERGIIGLVLWAAFYTIIFLYFWRNRKKRKKLTGLGVSILSLYLLFSIGTGELGSVYPTMLLLGFVIKTIEYQKLKKLYKLLVRLKQIRSGSPSSSTLISRLRLALLRHRLAGNSGNNK
ncbi:MAG: O-antigen ligase family protein [Prevotella sp.]|nr:O-antigen ligase family protein [Prevotella sp.]